MNIKKNEKSEAAELRACVSKLSNWQEGPPRSFLATHRQHVETLLHLFDTDKMQWLRYGLRFKCIALEREKKWTSPINFKERLRALHLFLAHIFRMVDARNLVYERRKTTRLSD